MVYVYNFIQLDIITINLKTAGGGYNRNSLSCLERGKYIFFVIAIYSHQR